MGGEGERERGRLGGGTGGCGDKLKRVVLKE